MKFLALARTTTFAVTLVSTIPLFINYLTGSAPKKPLIVHAHVWFGLLFFVFAIVSMVVQKKKGKRPQ